VRRLLFLALLAVVIWGAGLVVFATSLPMPTSKNPPKADGVVVFTGGGDRLTPAMSLLNQGVAERLLISGVNPSVTRPELAALWPGDPALFDCCVDLGTEAETTDGNAAELSDWTRSHGFTSLILVTSEFHMPRALLLARDRLPNVTITPYPVASGLLGPDGRPASLAGWRRMNAEYAKFLAAWAKTIVS
jgi:uncharacterized SAM-binding protein YcdF (DUF218 family)